MKKIKLLFSSYFLDYGGIEKSLLNLVDSLDSEKYDITIVLEKKEGVFLDKISKNIKILEYTPCEIKNKFIRKTINLTKKIFWTLKHYHRFDVSICYATYSMSSNFIARMSSRKRIIYVHSNYCALYENNEKDIKKFFDCKHLNKYNKIIFVSNESKEELVKYYPNIKNKSLVLNNIVDVNDILIKSNYNCLLLNDHKPLAVFIGRMEEEVKLISKILALAKSCQNNKKSISFLLIGNGPDFLDLKVQSKNLSLKNVQFLGAVENPYPYLKKANFLILSSKYEGFPVVYNEAIILDKPILSTIQVSDDEISINNRFGIICDSDNMYNNIDKILSFKNEQIDFNEINKRRIVKFEKLLSELYEKK